MKVSYAYIQAFVAQLDALNVQAGKTIVAEAKKRDIERKLQDSELEFEDVYAILNSVAPTYAKISSALTCRYYDGIRQASGVPDDYRAEVSDTLTREDLATSARRVYSSVSKGQNTVPLTQLLADEVSGITRKASNDTVYQNAARDPQKPKFAIVPSPSACAFCKLIAANGYEYPSESSANRHAGSFHKNCSCQATQVYGDGAIQGYDPGKYAKEYETARDAFKDGKISKDLQERIDDAKKRHQEAYAANMERFRKGEITREQVGEPWRERNAVLMVWREMDKQR